MSMENFKSKYLWFFAPYFLATGILFIWGYWSSFKINAFEYASINEAIMASFIPLASTFILALIGASIGIYSSQQDKQSTYNSAQTHTNKMSPMDWVIFTFCFLPAVILFVITENEGLRWTMSLTLLSAIPASYILKSNFLTDISPSYLRSFLIFILCCTPLLSFSTGKSEAIKILNNSEYKYIEHEGAKYKYVGHLQGKTFFVNLTNEKILIIHDEEYESLLLTLHKENP
jgi:hypothetical protein